MKILVVSATELEIQPFLDANQMTDVLITGVGAGIAIYQIQKKLREAHYDHVIQAGIGGAFNHEIHLGETVVVKQDSFGDVGTEEKGTFTTIFDAGLGDKNAFPFKNGWLVNTNELLKIPLLKIVSAVTVNKISDSEIQQQQLIQTFNPDIESMEGAALHYVCLQEKISFVQLRSISNYVGIRDKSKWKMKDAIKILNTELFKIVNSLTN